jgi:hypothetical protein
MTTYSFKDFLTEDYQTQNKHLNHIQELVLENGASGLRTTIGILTSLRDMLNGHSPVRVDVSTKFDGAPAIICGRNPENEKFFVSTKGVFAKTPKINYTIQDIDKNHPGEGLNQKLKLALKYLPELGFKPGHIVQGDMMYTKPDLKQEKIEGQDYLTFQPNTIVYSIPLNDPLAKRISNSKLGIVFHTTYSGDTMSSLRTSPGVAIGALRPNKDVWFRDAALVDASGTASFTKSETDQLNQLIKEIQFHGSKIPGMFLNKIATSDTYKILIKAWNNLKVRSGEEISNVNSHTLGFIQNIEAKYNRSVLEAKKQETRNKRIAEKNIIVKFFKDNALYLRELFHLQNLIVDAKHFVLKKFEQIQDIGTFLKTSDGFKVTKPEGFVVVDRISKEAVKIVSQMEFSHANFTAQKNWTK